MKDLMMQVKEVMIIIGLFYLLINASGCNTINGLGEDLQRSTSSYVNK